VRGTLPVSGGSNVVKLRLSDAGNLPAAAEVTLSLAGATQPVIAANCFLLSPGRSEIIRLLLGRHVMDELGLLGRLPAIVRVRTAASGSRPTSSHYLLVQRP
jgi:hypothetical protein